MAQGNGFDDFEYVTDRLPFGRVVIIDENGLAALGEFRQHVIDDLIFLFIGHFMEQEETTDQIVTILHPDRELGRVAANDLGPVHARQLAGSVFNLNRGNVGEVKRPLGPNFFAARVTRSPYIASCQTRIPSLISFKYARISRWSFRNNSTRTTQL